jgi:AcrR family transcriptional regulator
MAMANGSMPGRATTAERDPGNPDDPAAQGSTATRLTREQSRANTRERLLAAARGAFARSGFHGASVEEIASEAGFSTGALYSNFDGKEDLFLVLMEREIDEHAAEIAAAVGGG